MPFTISHVAAVLPFARILARWRVLSAAVIGSMVPDFGFLMPWRPDRVETHSAPALLTFCVPVGLATFWIFQLMVKPAFTEVLPDDAYLRWQPFAEAPDIGNIREWGMAVIGILAGALTHLVWDGFTHEGARGVRMIPAIDEPVVDFAGHHLIGARLLQDVSSLVGLAVVLALLAYGLRRGVGKPQAPPRLLRPTERGWWLLGYLAAALLLAAAFLQGRRAAEPWAHSLGIMIAITAIAVLRGFAAGILVVSAGLVVRLRASPCRPASSRDP